MKSHRGAQCFPLRIKIGFAAALLIGAAAGGAVLAQTVNPPPMVQNLPSCVAPPPLDGDTWPIAATDVLGTTSGPLVFSSASLLANDIGAAPLWVTKPIVTRSGGGTVTGNDPFTYTPSAGFTGTVTFTYEVNDAVGRKAIGLVKVTVAADAIAPVVSLTAPAAGTVSATVLVSASASDNVGVAGVRFLDGPTQIGAEITAAPFQVSWNTTTVANGAHTLTAIARDAAGNSATSSPVAVTVSNADTTAPVVSLTAPAAGTVSATVTVSASASDNVGVAGVRFLDGATQIGAEITAAPFQVSWNTTAVANGGHTLTAIARDAAGNSATSSPVAVTVSNAAPLAVPTVDKLVFSEGLGKRTTPAFSTTKAGDVLVAFAASDGPAAANAQTLTIAGAGLTWTRVKRAAARFGDAEIWTATASTVLTNVTVSSTQSSGGLHQSLTVIAFTGVAGIGASNAAGAATGASTASLVTQAAGSAVYGVGNDWDRAVARSIPAGQTKVHEFVDSAVGDTFWVQALATTVAAAGATATLNATAPTTDQWNFAIVELRAGVAPPPPPPPPPPVMVSVPPIVGLTQAAAQTAITTAGLTVGTVTSANSATVPSGQVISQSPTSGTSVATGSAVSFVVSLGPAVVAGPVLTMSFNEASGTVATDGSGNGNNGTIAGATRVTGQTGFGGALSFDGTSSIVNIAHSASLALSAGMTLEAWVNPSANAGVAPNGGWRTVILKELGATDLAYALYGNDGNPNPSRPAGYINIGGTDRESTAAPALPVGVWSHLAVTFDGAAIRLYVNGALRSTTAVSGTIAASTAPLRIGGNTVFSSPGTEFFAGLIDDVRVYNRALSAAEITTDMNTSLQ